MPTEQMNAGPYQSAIQGSASERDQHEPGNGLVWGGVHLLNWHYLAAQLVATLLVLGLTFRLNRSWTFA